jgi:hypothetical protein
MACVKILGRKNINSLTKKIPIKIKMVGLPKELLFITHQK